MTIANISPPAMNANLRLVTKSKSGKKVAKMRNRTIIYRTNAEIAFLPPFGLDRVSSVIWHAICNTCIYELVRLPSGWYDLKSGTRFALHVIYIVQQIVCHLWVLTCPAISRMICLFDDQSDAMSDRAVLRYTICFATDAISSSAMNVSLRLATKSKACEKVAKLRYQTIIYR